MRTHIERVRDKVTALTSRLFRRPTSSPESLTPTCPEETIQLPDSTIITPAIDYRGIALGYFAEKLAQRSPSLPPTEILANDLVLKGVDRKALRTVIETREDIDEIARGLAELLPDQLQRKARRTLTLWQEQESRREKNMTDSIKNVDSNGQKPKEAETQSESTPPELEAPIETQPIRNYGIGRIIRTAAAVGNSYGDRIEILSEEQITAFIEDRANKLAIGDDGMLTDCTSIIDFLRDNPTSFGNLGVKRLTDRRIFIAGKNLPIYSLSPNKTPELKLSRRHANSLRAAYLIYTSGDSKIVVLDGDGIFTHEQYDKKYSTSKGKSKTS